jgi:hypothetical protein
MDLQMPSVKPVRKGEMMIIGKTGFMGKTGKML